MEGERLGPYAIDRELGAGGMGKVYAATVTGRTVGLSEGSRVALKVVHPHLLETPGFFKRFMREAQLGQSIRHANVVRTLDCDQDFTDGKPQCFLVMEYVEGQTLAELLGELERVPEELCRHVAREICQGLTAIHDAGVVHRDLKPENVLITPDHVVKVMDLGVAKLSDEALRLSKSGAFVGSVEYAAPEQFKGGDVDGRTDLHALGLLLYELSSGTHPYRGGTFHEVLGRVCDEDPRRLGEVNPQLSAFFEEVVHTLLVKDPRGRFASATQLLDVLADGEESTWWHERARSLQAETKRPIRRMRIPRETAVYGRDDELAKLRALYDVATSRGGRVVLIEGEAGIGKSRLVDELIARLHADGEDFNFLVGGYPPGGAATADGGFSAAFREQLGEAGSRAYLPENQILVPAFDALLRGEGAPDGAQALTSGSLQTCFARALQALAAERTTIVLIDDLHFAPEEGRALFSSLANAVSDSRAVLIGSTRPGVSEEWRAGLTRLAQTTQVAVERLGPKDLVALLADSLGSKHLAEDLAGRIAVKSDGNPFFAFEIIRGLREGQFITQKPDGTWASTQIIEEIEIPSSVLDLVNARVADLTEEERNVLDVAACSGFEFDPLLLGEVLEMKRIPLLRTLSQIERRHRLVRSAGLQFVFDHHQVQEALYESLPELLRREYHAALAEALEARVNAPGADPATLEGRVCTELCEHYFKGARAESALRYLPAARKHLSESHLHAQVAGLTERALAAPGLLVGTARAEMLLRLAETLNLLARRRGQEEAAREAERLAEDAGDEKLRVRAAAALGTVLVSTSRYEEAATIMGGELERALARADTRAETVARAILSSALLVLGRLPEAQEHSERALAISRERGDKLGELSASAHLGNVLLRQGRFHDARACYERDLELSIETGHRGAEARATSNLGIVAQALGLLDEARTYYDRALAVSRETGIRNSEAAAVGNIGALLSSNGRLVESQAYTEQHLALCRELGDRQGEAVATSCLGANLWVFGRMAQAREAFVRSLAMNRETGNRSGEAMDRYNLGIVAREEGDNEEAETHLRASITLCEESGYRPLVVWMKRGLGSLLLATGDARRGREELEAAIVLAREVGNAGDETLARCELALLPDGCAADALAAFVEHETQIDPDDLREVRYLLWRSTGDRTHLVEAKLLLDGRRSGVPVEHHASMLENVRVNREIMEAWRAEVGGDADESPDDDEPRSTESVTRVG